MTGSEQARYKQLVGLVRSYEATSDMAETRRIFHQINAIAEPSEFEL